MATVDLMPGVRTCSTCREAKPLDAFPRQKSGRDGRYPHCTPCSTEKAREYRARNAEKIRRRKQERYLANRDQERASARDRYRANPQWARPASWRAQGIDLTWQEYLDLAEAQGHVCAICGKSEEANGKGLAVDHDHVTGVVRGLLCDDCNLALGRFQDSPDLLNRALDYLGAQHLKEK